MDKPGKQSTAPATKYITVDLPETGFATVTYVNRFGIERLDDASLLYFGLTTKAGEVKAVYSAVVTDVFVRNSREEWLDYLGKVGSPPDSAIDLTWRPPSSRSERVDVVNAIRIARSGAEAELRVYCVSLVSVIDAQRGAKR